MSTTGGKAKPKKKAAKAKRPAPPAAKIKKKPSAALADVIGAAPITAPQAISKIWKYIKAKKLQNPANMRNVLCDDKLKALFGKKEVTMFEIAGVIHKNLK